MALTNKLTNIADAIRRKNGETAKYTLPQMVEKIDAIDTGGDDVQAIVQDVLTKSIALTFGDSAFKGLNQNPTGKHVKSITLPNVTTMGSYAFHSCSNLTNVSLPQVTTMGGFAFAYCSGLTSASLPQVTTMGDHAFYQCSNLTSVSLPQVTTMESPFYKCSSLTSVELPELTTLQNRHCFYGCSSLEKLSLPKLKEVTPTGQEFCASCSKLTALVLGNEEQVVTLSTDWYLFNSTPIINGTGYIYVPDALVDNYKTAQYWKKFASQIKPISELPA